MSETVAPGSAPTVLDSKTLRQAYGCFPSGVVSICAMDEGGPVGLVASSFVAVSIDPPLVSFCIQHSSSTWPRLRGLPRLGVSVLGEAHDVACLQLSAKTGDRFAGLALRTTDDGAVFVQGAPVTLDCTIEDQLAAGDHQIVLLRAHAVEMDQSLSPLVFHGSAFASLRKLETVRL